MLQFSVLVALVYNKSENVFVPFAQQQHIRLVWPNTARCANPLPEAAWVATYFGVTSVWDFESESGPKTHHLVAKNREIKQLVGGLEHFFFHNIWDNPSH